MNDTNELYLIRNRYEARLIEYRNCIRDARFDQRDKVHQIAMAYGVGFLDFLEGFHAVFGCKYELAQTPALILRGMYEAMVKLQFMSTAAGSRDEKPSELLKRVNSLLLSDEQESEKLRNSLPEHIRNELNSTPREKVSDLILDERVYQISIYRMLEIMGKDVVDASYPVYRKLSEKAHVSLEGMRSILVQNGTGLEVRAFAREAGDSAMWYECAERFTSGALDALTTLLKLKNSSGIEGART